MASRLDGRSDAPLITRRRHVLACARCRARRVKCDRAQPACSNCVKVGALCQPVQTGGPSHSTVQSRVGSREPAEQNRLSKLEEQVARLSREVDSRSPSREPSHSPSPPQFPEDHPYIVQGRIIKGGRTSTYISPYSWAAAADEVIDVDSLIGESFDEETHRYGATDDAIPLVDDRLHDVLLGVFSQRVDPLIHILHWPSFLERCHEYRRHASSHASPAMAAVSSFAGAYSTGTPYNSPPAMPYSNPAGLPANTAPLRSTPATFSTEENFLTLLYSVYFASLVSIIQSPNPPNLGQNINSVTLCASVKREVLKRISKLDNGPTRADSIDTIQAMVLYISVEFGNTNPQMQWLQLGTAIRIAQSAGIHRDPLGFGFGPIETESRRRLWAQICILDTRLADQLCREPTIAPDSYDIILPLSIGDQELTEIQRHTTVPEHGNMANVLGLDTIEREQQEISPFSSTTLMLVESEMARQQQQALCFRYQPRDRPVSGNSGSPQLTRRAIPFAGRPGRTSWANALKDRYASKYQWDRLSSSDPIQYLASEMCQINVMKATFTNRLAQRKETSGPTSTPSGHSEALSIFQDALQLSARCAALTQQYSNSPYNWYIRRIRDASSCSFLALVLASELPISHEASSAAWSVLDQLFSTENSSHNVEPELQKTFMGKVLEKAREKRVIHGQAPLSQQYRDPTMNVGSAGYPVDLTQYPPNTFQTSGNIYNDWDALMQESVWSAGVSASDQSYWPSQATPASIPRTPVRHQSRPFESGGSYPPPTLPLRSNAPTQYNPQLPLPSTTDTESAPSCKAPYVDAAASSSHWIPGPPIHIRAYSKDGGHGPMQLSDQLTPSSSWPRQLGSLQVPHSHGRERSASQPPVVQHSQKPSAGPPKRRLTSGFDERPSVFDRAPQ